MKESQKYRLQGVIIGLERENNLNSGWHSFIPDISIEPLQVNYYARDSEVKLDRTINLYMLNPTLLATMEDCSTNPRLINANAWGYFGN